MFTWICPNCGGEVPPAYSECPHCQKNQEEVTKTAEPGTTPKAIEEQVISPEGAGVEASSKRRWWYLVGIAAVVVAGALGSYVWLRPEKPAIQLEKPPEAGAAVAAKNPYQDYIEVAGIRITETEDGKLRVRYVLINHSAAAIDQLQGTIRIRRTTDPSEAQPLLEFSFDVKNMAPYGVREVSVLLPRKLRAYEIPDWQFLKPEVVLQPATTTSS